MVKWWKPVAMIIIDISLFGLPLPRLYLRLRMSTLIMHPKRCFPTFWEITILFTTFLSYWIVRIFTTAVFLSRFLVKFHQATIDFLRTFLCPIQSLRFHLLHLLGNLIENRCLSIILNFTNLFSNFSYLFRWLWRFILSDWGIRFVENSSVEVVVAWACYCLL